MWHTHSEFSITNEIKRSTGDCVFKRRTNTLSNINLFYWSWKFKNKFHHKLWYIMRHVKHFPTLLRYLISWIIRDSRDTSRHFQLIRETVQISHRMWSLRNVHEKHFRGFTTWVSFCSRITKSLKLSILRELPMR